MSPGYWGNKLTVTVANVLEEIVRDIKATRKIPTGKIHPSGRLLRSFERDGADKLSRAFSDLRRRLFSGLSDDSVEQVVSRMSDADIMRPFRDTLEALIRDWALAGADFGREQVERAIFGTQKQVADGIAVDWMLANDMAADWARGYSFSLVSGIEDTTKRYLQREVSGFATSGETFQQFSRRMVDASVFSPTRAQMIAVTEVTRSYAQGNVQAWTASGVTEGKEWNTANDELVCPICGPLDGKQTKLDGKFDGSYEGPPAHPRCRCWLTPVAIGDLTPGEDLLTPRYGALPFTS